MRLNRLPPSATSATRYTESWVWNTASRLTMLGWLARLRITISSSSLCRMSVDSEDFWICLMADLRPDAREIPTRTAPNVPRPSSAPSVKASSMRLSRSAEWTGEAEGLPEEGCCRARVDEEEEADMMGLT